MIILWWKRLNRRIDHKAGNCMLAGIEINRYKYLSPHWQWWSTPCMICECDHVMWSYSLCSLTHNWPAVWRSQAEILGQMFQDCKWGFALCIHFFNHLVVVCVELPKLKRANDWVRQKERERNCKDTIAHHYAPCHVRMQAVVLKLQHHGQHLS